MCMHTHTPALTNLDQDVGNNLGAHPLWLKLYNIKRIYTKQAKEFSKSKNKMPRKVQGKSVKKVLRIN